MGDLQVMNITKTYFTNIQMRNSLIQIEDQMAHTPWMPTVILGINRGGCIPGVYLSHRLKVPHEPLDVRLRDHKNIPDIDRLRTNYNKGERILVLDDINDTGSTFNYITKYFGKPNNVKSGAVINNKSSLSEIDYFGYEIDKNKDDQWIVFPWEEWDK